MTVSVVDAIVTYEAIIGTNDVFIVCWTKAVIIIWNNINAVAAAVRYTVGVIVAFVTDVTMIVTPSVLVMSWIKAVIVACYNIVVAAVAAVG